MLERKRLKGRPQVTFALPEGSPAAHPREPRDDRARAARVSLPARSAHSFRYLAAGDYWFDDEHADQRNGTNSRSHT
ncbi:hypothetical protein ACFWFZ_01505 [Streptomyces sp. NPDC060232]|uniref:hypothetical protein n=1 Tax=Streptomyces sp. NPDC060232 TaxID=3347079 RepID=UPI00365B6E20